MHTGRMSNKTSSARSITRSCLRFLFILIMSSLTLTISLVSESSKNASCLGRLTSVASSSHILITHSRRILIAVLSHILVAVSLRILIAFLSQPIVAVSLLYHCGHFHHFTILVFFVMFLFSSLCSRVIVFYVCFLLYHCFITRFSS